MLTPKKQYEICTQHLINISDRLLKLQKNPAVQEYMRLEREYEETKEEQDEIFQKMKYAEYDSCSHILVYTKEEYVKEEEHTYTYQGCIKCGLDESILKSNEKNRSLEDQTQYDYLRSKGETLTGLHTEVECGIALAQKIYEEIKAENKDITDEQLVDLFIQAYTNMKTTDIHKIKIKGNNK